MTKSRFLVSNETIGLSPATTRSRPKARRATSRVRSLASNEITGLSPATGRSTSSAARRASSHAGVGGRRSSFAYPAPLRCAAYATLADIQSGIAGGLGLIELAADALDLEIAMRFRDPIDHRERLSFDFGVGALRAAALARRFNVLLVSSPCSLGADLKVALRTFGLMTACNVDVFAGCCGWLDARDFVRFYDPTPPQA